MRLGMLLLAAGLMLVALGATDADMAPSARCVAVSALLALFAPLFWPGAGATPAQTARRIAGWSIAVTGLAAALLLATGLAAKPMPAARQVLGACSILLPILLLTHALAAGLEALWRGPFLPSATAASLAADATTARAMAGTAAALAVALAGALPIWFGPAAELLSSHHEGASDVALALSPLMHLAVASGNDLLRDAWFYQHANLAALPVSYPGLAPVFSAYTGAVLLSAVALLALARRRRARHLSLPTPENLPS